MKHFDLPTDLADASQIVPVETRFVVMGDDGIAYGLTYKWNENGDEAVLQQSSSSGFFDIYDNGVFAYTQEWDYPGRSNCMRCHNASAGFVLGMNTHQMNRPNLDLHASRNQLEHFNALGIFENSIRHADFYNRSYPITEAGIPLEIRIRSYWDANCAYCHRENGPVPTSDIDLRYNRPLIAQNVIDYPTRSVASANEFVITPGDHSTSELWVRDASLNTTRMPPLASNLVDQVYIDSLAKWIDNFEFKPLSISEVSVVPNPADDYVVFNLGGDWLPQYEAAVFDINGRLVRNLVVNNNPFVLNVANYPPGTYLFVFTKNTKRECKKIVIF